MSVAALFIWLKCKPKFISKEAPTNKLWYLKKNENILRSKRKKKKDTIAWINP